ncbi:MAG: hypothetical protein ABIA21_03285 [Candidatus Aenigmatarchaeota archaeon]
MSYSGWSIKVPAIITLTAIGSFIAGGLGAYATKNLADSRNDTCYSDGQHLSCRFTPGPFSHVDVKKGPEGFDIKQVTLYRWGTKYYFAHDGTGSVGRKIVYSPFRSPKEEKGNKCDTAFVQKHLRKIPQARRR